MIRLISYDFIYGTQRSGRSSGYDLDHALIFLKSTSEARWHGRGMPIATGRAGAVRPLGETCENATVLTASWAGGFGRLRHVEESDSVRCQQIANTEGGRRLTYEGRRTFRSCPPRPSRSWRDYGRLGRRPVRHIAAGRPGLGRLPGVPRPRHRTDSVKSWSHSPRRC